MVPESAPFSEEQRAWLNGFLAGWIGLQGGEAPSSMPTQTATALLDAPTAEHTMEDFPWHDPALPIDDRLQMSVGRPAADRLMSAMAQLDCGSCGYDCRRYAEAIVSGEEKSLKLCSPGGKDTAKVLKELHGSTNGAGTNGTNGANGTNGSSNGHVKATNGNGHAAGSTSLPPVAQWSRANPFTAKVGTIRNLNGAGSDKFTAHVEIDLAGGDLKYDVGDSLGVYPTNCHDLVQHLIEALLATGDEEIAIDEQRLSLREALATQVCLTEITDELLDTMCRRCADVTQSEGLKRLQADATSIETWDVLELLRNYPAVRLPANEFIAALSRMKPRLYSISSSLKAAPNQVHLTVGRVSWKFGERTRKGVASTMFADRLADGHPVRIFVQKSHGFSVPATPESAAIMIGPGTGIAPFRAFLQERQATAAPGKNWLFFGDQRSTTDFLYRDELEALCQSGTLTRLETAFSRDQAEKIYVQDRMLQHGAELWQWIEAGAYIYVCGDAKRMAVDVDKALKRIVTEYGGKSAEEAAAYVAQMAKSKRYCRDVY